MAIHQFFTECEENTKFGADLSLFAFLSPIPAEATTEIVLEAMISLMNLTGQKKYCSNKERLKFADENLDEILRSTADPMECHWWITQSDNSWQTLSICREIWTALECRDPSQFKSHVPGHQVGTYNAIQHKG